jgi:hypothetical protein
MKRGSSSDQPFVCELSHALRSIRLSDVSDCQFRGISIDGEFLFLILSHLPFPKFVMVLGCVCKTLSSFKDTDAAMRCLCSYAPHVSAQEIPIGMTYVESKSVFANLFNFFIHPIANETSLGGGAKFSELFPHDYMLPDALVPENIDRIPHKLSLWMYRCATNQADPEAPINCVASVQAAGFFSTLKLRKRFIQALVASNGFLSDSVSDRNTPLSTAIIKVGDFLIDLARESYQMKEYHVNSQAWYLSCDMRGEHTARCMVGVCEADVQRLNVRHGLNMVFDFPPRPSA